MLRVSCYFSACQFHYLEFLVSPVIDRPAPILCTFKYLFRLHFRICWCTRLLGTGPEIRPNDRDFGAPMPTSWRRCSGPLATGVRSGRSLTSSRVPAVGATRLCSRRSPFLYSPFSPSCSLVGALGVPARRWVKAFELVGALCLFPAVRPWFSLLTARSLWHRHCLCLHLVRAVLVLFVCRRLSSVVVVVCSFGRFRLVGG